MRNLLRSTLAACALLQLLSLPLALATAVYEGDNGGCSLGDFPEVVELMKKNAALRYHAVHNDQPVQGLHLALEGPQGLRATWMNPASSGKFTPACLYGAEGSNLSHVVSGYSYTYTAGKRTRKRDIWLTVFLTHLPAGVPAARLFSASVSVHLVHLLILFLEYLKIVIAYAILV